MANKFDLSAEYLQYIRGVISDNLPPEVVVWSFGSRANGTAKKFSDIDLALDSTAPIAPMDILALKTIFQESDLPYKVDIIDISTATPKFLEHISRDRIRIP